MKKSFDYFKTLKYMSCAVGEAYKNMILTNEFNTQTIKFSGLNWELSNNLLNEFVTPIERGDIYNLAHCLSEEMYCISKLNNIFCLVNTGEFDFVHSLNPVFQKQNEFFKLLCDIKNFQKAFKFISETKAMLNGVNTSIVLSIKNCLKNTEQPLLKYAVASAFFDVYKSADTTFSVTQGVIINNI